MKEASRNAASRREFLQTTGRTAAAAALAAGTASCARQLPKNIWTVQ